jgi:hypothetical protein
MIIMINTLIILPPPLPLPPPSMLLLLQCMFASVRPFSAGLIVNSSPLLLLLLLLPQGKCVSGTQLNVGLMINSLLTTPSYKSPPSPSPSPSLLPARATSLMRP